MALAPDRGDGRKAHYGDGKQPWDTIKEIGWGPAFAASNVIKYLRRSKDPEHSLESARVYYGWLLDGAGEEKLLSADAGWSTTAIKLASILTDDELKLLRGS